jgi:hypothetical protein
LEGVRGPDSRELQKKKRKTDKRRKELSKLITQGIFFKYNGSVNCSKYGV